MQKNISHKAFRSRYVPYNDFSKDKSLLANGINNKLLLIKSLGYPFSKVDEICTGIYTTTTYLECPHLLFENHTDLIKVKMALSADFEMKKSNFVPEVNYKKHPTMMRNRLIVSFEELTGTADRYYKNMDYLEQCVGAFAIICRNSSSDTILFELEEDMAMVEKKINA